MDDWLPRGGIAVMRCELTIGTKRRKTAFRKILELQKRLVSLTCQSGIVFRVGPARAMGILCAKRKKEIRSILGHFLAVQRR